MRVGQHKMEGEAALGEPRDGSARVGPALPARQKAAAAGTVTSSLCCALLTSVETAHQQVRGAGVEELPRHLSAHAQTALA